MSIKADIQEQLEAELPEGWNAELVPVRYWLQELDGELVQLDEPLVIGYEVEIKFQDGAVIESFFKIGSDLQGFVAECLEEVRSVHGLRDAADWADSHRGAA